MYAHKSERAVPAPTLAAPTPAPAGPGNQALQDGLPAVSPEPSLLQAAEAQLDADLPAAPLDAAAVADALRYYRSQPWKYGPAVLLDLQERVGAPVTEVADEATVQGVARHQMRINRDHRPSPPLEVDGKAGPRTLPALAPAGLADGAQIDAYVDAVDAARPDLDAADADPRLAALAALVNERLAACRVPPVAVDWARDADGHPTRDAANIFDEAHWTILLKADALDDVARGATTVYHEARHAEQAFEICRMRAAEFAPSVSHADRVTSIAVRLQVPLHVAAAAADRPLTFGTTEMTVARNWHDEEPGRAFGGASAEAEALSAGIVAFLDGNLTFASLQPLLDAFLEADARGYRDQPREWDAFHVSDQVGDRLGVDRAPPTLAALIRQVAAQLGKPVPELP
ncbi:MAG: hypothetical protein R3F59_21790 [Myxococcota bacterium]